MYRLACVLRFLHYDGTMLHDPQANFAHRRMANGLDVYVLHLPERSWACVGVSIYGGAYADPVGKEGAAHLVEHLVAKYRLEPESASARRRYLEDNGLIGSGFMTGGPATIIQMKIIPEAKLHRALETLAEFVFDPLPWERLEAERSVVEQEFQRSYANTLAYDMSIWPYQALVQTSRWARSPSSLGTLASIRSLTREDLETYHAQQYQPRNMACVVVGKYDLDEVCGVLESTVFLDQRGGWRCPAEPRLAELPVLTGPLQGREVSFSAAGLASLIEPDQCGCSAYALLPNSVTALTMTLLADLLQQELFDDLRGMRAWTYGVDVSLVSTGIGGKMLSVQPEALKLAGYDCLRESIEAAIMRIQTRPELFEHVRRRAIRRIYMADLHMFHDLFQATLSDIAHDRRVFTLQEDLEELERMTHEDIVVAARFLTPDRFWTLCSKR